MKHLSAEVRKMMGSISSIDQNNYPEMLGRTCIINAPAVFKFVFAAVKPMFDPRTLAKMEVGTVSLRNPCFATQAALASVLSDRLQLCLAICPHLGQ